MGTLLKCPLSTCVGGRYVGSSQRIQEPLEFSVQSIHSFNNTPLSTQWARESESWWKNIFMRCCGRAPTSAAEIALNSAPKSTKNDRFINPGNSFGNANLYSHASPAEGGSAKPIMESPIRRLDQASNKSEVTVFNATPQGKHACNTASAKALADSPSKRTLLALPFSPGPRSG